LPGPPSPPPPPPVRWRRLAVGRELDGPAGMVDTRWTQMVRWRPDARAAHVVIGYGDGGRPWWIVRCASDWAYLAGRTRDRLALALVPVFSFHRAIHAIHPCHCCVHTAATQSSTRWRRHLVGLHAGSDGGWVRHVFGVCCRVFNWSRRGCHEILVSSVHIARWSRGCRIGHTWTDHGAQSSAGPCAMTDIPACQYAAVISRRSM